MTIIKRIRSGTLIPKWYGIAWRHWETNEAVCLPLGLNMLAALGRLFYITIRCGHTAVYDDSRDAYAQGVRDGARLPKNNAVIHQEVPGCEPNWFVSIEGLKKYDSPKFDTHEGAVLFCEAMGLKYTTSYFEP